MTVAWEIGDVDEHDRQFVPDSEVGLVYGREVHHPIARVLDVGPSAEAALDFRGRADGARPGDFIVATKDEGALFELGADRVKAQAIALERLNPRTERMEPTDEIAAVIRDGEPIAVGRRVLGVPVRRELGPLALHDVESTDQVRVVSIGARAHADFAEGDVVLIHRRAHGRTDWTQEGKPWVSVPAHEVLGVLEDSSCLE